MSRLAILFLAGFDLMFNMTHAMIYILERPKPIGQPPQPPCPECPVCPEDRTGNAPSVAGVYDGPVSSAFWLSGEEIYLGKEHDMLTGITAPVGNQALLDWLLAWEPAYEDDHIMLVLEDGGLAANARFHEVRRRAQELGAQRIPTVTHMPPPPGYKPVEWPNLDTSEDLKVGPLRDWTVTYPTP